MPNEQLDAMVVLACGRCAGINEVVRTIWGATATNVSPLSYLMDLMEINDADARLAMMRCEASGWIALEPDMDRAVPTKTGAAMLRAYEKEHGPLLVFAEEHTIPPDPSDGGQS